MTRYVVTIYFREPTFEARIGRKERPYRVSYDVTAASVERAEQSAIAQFEQTALDSWVSWVRQIVRVEVSVEPSALAG